MIATRVRLLPQQNAFRKCAAKWAAARGGVGSGKTTGVVWYALQRLEQYPRAAHFVVGADYEQLRRGFFQTLLGILENTLGWEAGKDFNYRETPSPMLTFRHSGARLRALSAEQAERIRSVEVQTLICEEPPTWQHGQHVFRVLIGRLRHSQRSARMYPALQPQGRMTFNPPPVGTWLHKLIAEQWPGEQYPCWRFSLRDNVLMSGLAEYVRQLEAMYPPELWPVEIDGEWGTLGGDVYRGFDLAVHAVDPPTGLPPIALDPTRPILWALDFNVEWMASVVCQVHEQMQVVRGTKTEPGKIPVAVYGPAVEGWQRDIIYCLDQIFLHDAGTPDAVDAFVARYGEMSKKVGVYLYGDPSGGARAQAISSHSAARSNWEIVLAGLRDAGIPVTVCVRTHAPAVMDRINAVRAQFRTGAGVGFLIDAQRCPDVITDFQSVQFKTGSNDIDKSDHSDAGLRRTHLSDAIGYLIDVHRRARAGERLEYQHMAR